MTLLNSNQDQTSEVLRVVEVPTPLQRFYCIYLSLLLIPVALGLLVPVIGNRAVLTLECLENCRTETQLL